jgi:hypothetical protein
MARLPRPVDPPPQKPEELDAAFVKRGITPEWETLFKEVPPKEARDYLKAKLARLERRQDRVSKLTTHLLGVVLGSASMGALLALVDYLKKWIGK